MIYSSNINIPYLPVNVQYNNIVPLKLHDMTDTQY